MKKKKNKKQAAENERRRNWNSYSVRPLPSQCETGHDLMTHGNDYRAETRNKFIIFDSFRNKKSKNRRIRADRKIEEKIKIKTYNFVICMKGCEVNENQI